MAKKPKILILGYARHGKDTVAEMLEAEYGFTFRSSSLFLAEKAVKPALEEHGLFYGSVEECYADRVNHRDLWHDIIVEYNREDPARLAKEILAEADIYIGMRSDREYQASRDLFDVIVWVDASKRGVPSESSGSMTIEPDPTTMRWIDNNGSLDDLWATVGDLFCGW